MLFYYLTLCLSLITMIKSSIHEQLKSIDQLISIHRNKKINTINQQIHLQKLAHYSIPTNQSVTLHQSIRISSKMKAYPNILIDNTNIYSVDGQLLISFPQNSIFSSIRNQNMFVLSQEGSNLNIKEFVLKKKTFELETIFNLINVDTIATSFATGGGIKTKSIFLIAYNNGSLIKYSNKGQFKNQSDYFDSPIQKLTKTMSHFYAKTQTQIFILQIFKPLQDPQCIITPAGKILNYINKGEQMLIHIQGQLLIYSISKCEFIKHYNVPFNSQVNQLGDRIFVTKQNISYFLNPVNDYSMGMINLKLPLNYKVSTAKKSQFSTLISINCLDSNEVSIYEYSWQGQQQSFQMKGFKVPVMIIIFGIIMFYTYKNKKEKQSQGSKYTDKDNINEDLEGLQKLTPEQLQQMLEQIKVSEKKIK